MVFEKYMVYQVIPGKLGIYMAFTPYCTGIEMLTT